MSSPLGSPPLKMVWRLVRLLSAVPSLIEMVLAEASFLLTIRTWRQASVLA